MSITTQTLPLAQADPVLWEILKKEDHRQRSGLEMIASEVAIKSPLTNQPTNH
jgi:glycine/serine hydroxymethyltransferase